MTWLDLGYYLGIVLTLCALVGVLVGVALFEEIRDRDEE